MGAGRRAAHAVEVKVTREVVLVGQVEVPRALRLEHALAALHQAPVHGLALREDLEEGVVPLGDVQVQQAVVGEAAVALGARVLVRRVVMVLVLSDGVTHGAAARGVADDLLPLLVLSPVRLQRFLGRHLAMLSAALRLHLDLAQSVIGNIACWS